MTHALKLRGAEASTPMTVIIRVHRYQQQEKAFEEQQIYSRTSKSVVLLLSSNYVLFFDSLSYIYKCFIWNNNNKAIVLKRNSLVLSPADGRKGGGQ